MASLAPSLYATPSEDSASFVPPSPPSGGPASSEPPSPEPGAEPPSPYAVIGPFGGDRGLREAALVLTSQAIEHHVTYVDGGGALVVHQADALRARRALAHYTEENRDWPPRRTPERPRYGGFSFVIAAFAALVAFALVTGPSQLPKGPFFREGASVASLVLSSEPFRAITALTLHADTEHVVANFLSGSLFGRLAERRLGPGGALFGIVAAGALGNVANAVFYALQGEAHGSIGASTAVFGAVGLLAGTQIVLRLRRDPAERARALRQTPGALWQTVGVPIGGGLALLATLGASPNTDVWAHAYGLVAGVGVGLVAGLTMRPNTRVHAGKQVGMGLAALAVVGGAWAAALV